MIGQALAQVFSRGWYLALASVMALVTFVLSTWLGNLGLVWQVATSEGLPLTDKVRILLALIGSIATNFTIFSGAAVIGIAVLFGMNVAVIAYATMERRQLVGKSGPAVSVVSLGGLASGLLGIGCAACGTLLLSPALAFLGVGTLVALLPFGGEEFGALGVGLLSLSLIMSAKKIGQPMLCQVTSLPNQV